MRHIAAAIPIPFRLELIRTEHRPHVETAIQQGRATDRYHRFRLVLRKSPAASRHHEPESGCYGLYLWKGAILTLTSEDEAGVVREGGPLTVRLVHMFHFSRPGLTPEELRGERELRSPMVIEFPDRPQRPVDAVLDLGPHLLGPLPTDLTEALLPQPAVSGPRAAALASHLFAAWLGGLPPPPLVAAEAPGGATAAAADAAAAAPSSSWLSGLLGLWNRVLGGKAPSAAVAQAAAEGEEPEGERGKVAEPAGGGKEAGEAAAAPAPTMGLAEAWAQYEQRASTRDVDAAEGTALERAWFSEVLVPSK